MSSKRKAASGSTTVTVDNGEAHTAKRRKVPVSVRTVLLFDDSSLRLVIEMLWEEERSIKQAAAAFKHFVLR